jgi:hypothetical protein
MGSGASLSGCEVAIIPQAASPNRNSPKIKSHFIIGLLDGLMIQKLPYEKITKG